MKKLFALLIIMLGMFTACTKAPEFLNEVKTQFPHCDIYSQYRSEHVFIGVDTLDRDNVYIIYTGKAFKPDVTSVRKLDKR